MYSLRSAGSSHPLRATPWPCPVLQAHRHETSGTNDTFLAAIYLPDEAMLRSMRAFVWDDSTSQLVVRLYRVSFTSPAFDSIFSVSSTADAPGTIELLDDTPTSDAHAIVNNAWYGYFLTVECPGTWGTESTALRLHGVVIDYDAGR